MTPHLPELRYVAVVALVTGAPLLAVPCSAEPPRGIEIGLRANALSADPDLYGLGVTARYFFHDRWFVDATLERHVFRSRASDPFGAAQHTSIVVGAAFGREHAAGDAGQTSWFWTWGVAAGFPDAGPAGADGGSFETATGEIHLTASLGARRRLSERWSATGALRVERHYVDWRTTAADGRLLAARSSLTPAGLYFALSYRF